MPFTLPKLASVVALLLCVPVAMAQERTGEQIYKKDCARCHGTKGEGSKKYELPLTGDKSLPQLATVIKRTMP